VPAAIYVMAVGPFGEASAGWGVPVSTDTAFAPGVLALLGSRIAPNVRVLLLAIASVEPRLAGDDGCVACAAQPSLPSCA
ncbi:MAG TPA: Na+/H+ antiporter NhaA, partial [Gemmatimonadaceae bacterium]